MGNTLEKDSLILHYTRNIGQCGSNSNFRVSGSIQRFSNDHSLWIGIRCAIWTYWLSISKRGREKLGRTDGDGQTSSAVFTSDRPVSMNPKFSKPILEVEGYGAGHGHELSLQTRPKVHSIQFRL